MIRLPPDRTDAISAAIRRVTRAAQDAELATDTQAARERLTACRDLILDAAELINTAEAEARECALSKLEQAA